MDQPQLGHHFELCFSVSDLEASVSYYRELGFEIYSGGVDQGWCSLKSDLVYIGLYPNNFIEEEYGHPFLLNFRGGNTTKIKKFFEMQEFDLELSKTEEDGTGSLLTRDPDGVPLFIDTDPNEERVDH